MPFASSAKVTPKLFGSSSGALAADNQDLAKPDGIWFFT
jgi:hypothetical protein